MSIVVKSSDPRSSDRVYVDEWMMSAGLGGVIFFFDEGGILILGLIRLPDTNNVCCGLTDWLGASGEPQRQEGGMQSSRHR